MLRQRIENVSRATYLEENVGETCAKVGSVNVELLLTGQVDVDAAGAVHLDPRRREFL